MEKKLTFAQASKHILELNNNKPMTSDEILIEIFKLKLPLNSMGNSPERTLNTILNRQSTNSTASNQSKNKDFTIIRGFELADKYILANYDTSVITNVYLTVKLKIKTDTPLTEEQLNQVVSDVDYDFDYNEKGIRIVNTEIIDSQIK
jgi:hypothetical protein